MKLRYVVYFVLLTMAFASCQKNIASNIPHISFGYLGNTAGSDVVNVISDTILLQFTIIDGNANLGNDPNGTNYDLYINDLRYNVYNGYFFPAIDSAIEDPKKGLTGTCTYLFPIDTLKLRADSAHANEDTTRFAVYIVDKAGNHSDTIITPPLYMKK